MVAVFQASRFEAVAFSLTTHLFSPGRMNSNLYLFMDTHPDNIKKNLFVVVCVHYCF